MESECENRKQRIIKIVREMGIPEVEIIGKLPYFYSSFAIFTIRYGVEPDCINAEKFEEE